MNKKIFIWGIIIVLAIIIGFIIYKNINLQQEEIGLNETNQNIIEISELAKQSENAVTDECLNEWDDYNDYIGKKVEEASSNLTEQDTHYLLKDVYEIQTIDLVDMFKRTYHCETVVILERKAR